MEKQKDNKGYEPAENRQVLVKIRFKPGRAGEGAQVQDDGTATVSAEQAKYWVAIGYAEYVEGE